ncbi:MAG: hypothetical protein M0C28_26890 [Candidatus Moduliflexus flocculans]|nr:hypothetical protein [Candidatus Moduliflexus flocculans]
MLGGRNAVAASKGALVVGLPELRKLAAENGACLRFSGATAAALPTVDVGLFSLAGARISGIQGILNGTSNYILTRMGEGLDYGEALRVAQDQGIAEPDPSHDVGGWDTACKILLITNACLGSAYVLKDVQVAGHRRPRRRFRPPGPARRPVGQAAGHRSPGPERRALEPRRPALARRRLPPARRRQRHREGHQLPHRFHGHGHGDRRPLQSPRRRRRPPERHHQHLQARRPDRVDREALFW